MNESETLLLGELKGAVQAQGQQLEKVVGFMASIDRRLRAIEQVKAYALGVIAAVSAVFNILWGKMTGRNG